MKNRLIFLLSFFAVVPLFGAVQYEFESGTYGGKNGALNILEDISSLTIYSNFGSIGNSGSVGYYVYTDDPANAVYGATTFSKHDGAITITGLNAGDKVGFYLLRNNGRVLDRFRFIPYGDSYFLAFMKNNWNGKDEYMFLNTIVSEGSSVPSGQPLPGLLVTLFSGIVLLLLFRRRSAERKAA